MDRKEAAHTIFVALDVDSVAKAENLRQLLIYRVGGFKVGFEFLYSLLAKLMTQPNYEAEKLFWEARTFFEYIEGEFFFDGKLDDIGNTVKGAVKALARFKPLMFNVHTSAGRPAMEAARKAIDEATIELGLERKPLLLAVTLLTSLGEGDMVELGLKPDDVTEKYRLKLVVQRAKLAKDCGCDGVVASPLEAAAIRKACGPDFFIVTPGIRMPDSGKQDQKAVSTPAAALTEGADYLVIGRDITGAEDPSAAVERIIDHILQTQSLVEAPTASVEYVMKKENQ